MMGEQKRRGRHQVKLWLTLAFGHQISRELVRAVLGANPESRRDKRDGGSAIYCLGEPVNSIGFGDVRRP